MNVVDIVRQLSAAQVNIRLTSDDQLELTTGSQTVPAALLSMVKARKADLIAYLHGLTPDEGDYIAETANRDWYETANAQRRLWMVDKIETPRGAYTISSLQRIEGYVSYVALNQALTALAARHEILRTTFAWIEDGLKQRIHPTEQLPVTLEYEDLCALTDTEAIDTARQFMKMVVFDLETGPLWKVKLFRLDQQTYLLAFLMHHIISDKWSMQVLIDDINVLYSNALIGDTIPLPTLATQYNDYVDWQQQKMSSGAYDAHRAYWINQFSQEPAAITLPISRTRPAKKSLVGESRHRQLSRETVDCLRQLSTAYGVSTFNVLLAVTQTLLHRYTGQDELTVGTSVLGRNHAGLKNQIGYYANVLPLRTTFARDQSFATLLANSRAMLAGALEHQDYPFDKLVDDLGLQRDASRSPLFDVMVDYQYINAQPTFDGFTMREIIRQETDSKFDLSFTFYQEGDAIVLRLEYATDLFEGSWINTIFGHFENLVQASAHDPLAPLAALNYLSEREKNTLLTDFGTGEHQNRPQVTIKELFEIQADCTPHAVAIDDNGMTLTYGQLNQKSNRVARWLMEAYRVRPGDVVGLWAERSDELIVALMGIVKTGAAFLPIDHETPKERLAYMLRDSQAPLVLTTSDRFFELADFYDGQMVAIDLQLDGLTAYDGSDLVATPKPKDLAYVLYTSGSTGKPKGVEIRKNSIVNYLLFANRHYFSNGVDQAMPLFTSLAFDLTLTTIFSPLLRGDKVTIMPAKPIHTVLQEVFNPESDLRAVKLTPAHVSLLASLPVNRTKIDCAIVGGEALLEEHIQTLKRLNPAMRIYNEYGPTETTVGCTVVQIEPGEPITIGRPIENTCIYILDADLRLVPVGVWGQLCVGGDGVGVGYRNSNELTQKKFSANPFHSGMMYQTGDRARWLPDGRLEYQGRMDSQLKLRGYRVEPGEIEVALTNHPAVKEAAVLVKGKSDENKQLVAYITTDCPGASVDYQLYLSVQLPAYMIPTRIVSIETMPLTINGKIDRGRLNALDDSGEADETAYSKPQNVLEQTLAGIFERILEVNHISTERNLFEVGLNSLKAIKAQLEINALFPDRVEIHQLFSHPTIRKLAAQIGGESQLAPQTPAFETIEF